MDTALTNEDHGAMPDGFRAERLESQLALVLGKCEITTLSDGGRACRSLGRESRFGAAGRVVRAVKAHPVSVKGSRDNQARGLFILSPTGSRNLPHSRL